MKTKINLLLVALFAAAVASPAAFAQSPDPQIERLAKAVDLIGRINALPIDFRTVTAGDELTEAIAPAGLANLSKIAALLGQLPAGTTVEIGAHVFPLEETVFESGGPAAEQSLTDRRAALVRRELVRLGVRVRLTAKGYGATRPRRSNATIDGQLGNQRVEFMIEKLPPAAAGGITGAVEDDAIVAGRGWRRVVLGASRAQVEAALGAPEKFYEGNPILPDPSAHYFARGLIVVYDASSGTAKSIDFVGDPERLDAGSYAGAFRRAEARPDRNLAWGAAEAQIVAAYGAPKNLLAETRRGAGVVTLTYERIAFTLHGDRLSYISVSGGDRAAPEAANEKPPAPPVDDDARPVVYEPRYKIVAGEGAGPLRLGATRAAIEAAFCRPDELVDEDAGAFRIYEASYYGSGVRVEYDSRTQAATTIMFFGATGGSAAFGKFRLFPGETELGVRWGASPAAVMRAYGKPVEERMRYNPKIDRDYEFVTYPNVAFGFRDNRLYYISIDPVWGRPKK